MRTIYVVYEEDRGMGVHLVTAFVDYEKAEEFASESSHLFVEPVTVQDMQGFPYKG